MSFISQINKTSIAAAKLASAVELAIAGDATGTTTFDGSQGVSISVTLANNATARSNLGLGSVATLNTGVAAGNVPVLDSNGKLASTVIPKMAITDVFVETYTGTTKADAEDAMETGIAALTAEVGDVAVYTYSWTSPSAGSVSGTLIKSAEGSTFDKWTPLASPTDAALEELRATVNAHIGAKGTTVHGVADTTNAGFMPALSGTATNVLVGDGTWVDHIGLGGTVHAVFGAAAGFAPAAPAQDAASSFLAGNGSWINHIGLGGSVHATATSSAAGFMPALPATDGAGKYLNGLGQWASLSEITAKTIIETTGATPGAFTKVGDHIGVAIDATHVYSHGVVEYTTGQAVGTAIFVKDNGTVVYGNLTNAAAGTYYQVGYVVDSTSIEISAAQTVYDVVA